MTKQTLKKHIKILSFLLKEFKKHYEREGNFIIKNDLTQLISALQSTLMYLNNYHYKFNRKDLYALNKKENDLLDILNEYYTWLNENYNKITIEKILK